MGMISYVLYLRKFAIDYALNKATDEDKDNIHIHISSLNINGSPFTDNIKIQEFASGAGYYPCHLVRTFLKRKTPRSTHAHPSAPNFKTKGSL